MVKYDTYLFGSKVKCMTNENIEKQIIESYQKEEKMMILIFAQWCVNNDLKPFDLYIQAYPDQKENDALREALELTVPKEEAGDIPLDTVLNTLDFFGNTELAAIVHQVVDVK